MEPVKEWIVKVNKISGNLKPQKFPCDSLSEANELAETARRWHFTESVDVIELTTIFKLVSHLEKETS